MRAIVLLFLLGTLSDVAIAQTPECRLIPKASDRLACYDKAAPPTTARGPAASRTPAVSDTPGQAPPADGLAVENAKLDAKIKNICRGC
jgi:hypothetical protein